MISVEAFNQVSAASSLAYNVTGGISFGQLGSNGLENDLSSDVALQPATIFNNAPGQLSERFSLRAAGNLDGGGGDVVMLDQNNGHKLAFYAGLAPAVVPPAPLSDRTVKTAVYSMATPLNDQTVIRTLSTIDLGTTSATALNMSQAQAINGAVPGESLGAARSIGDLNGDGLEDFLWETTTNYYIAYGPIPINSGDSIADVADLVLLRTSGPFVNYVPSTGHMLPTAGKHDDLLFTSRTTQNIFADNLNVSVIRGGETLPRDLNRVQTLGTTSSSDARFTTTTIPIQAQTPVSISTTDWDGDGLLDLVVFQPRRTQTLLAGPQLIVYSGAALAVGGLNPLFNLSDSLEGATSIENVGDVNGDGKEDILVIGQPGSGANLAWRSMLIAGGSTFFSGTLSDQLAITGITTANTNAPAIYKLGDVGSWSGANRSGKADGYDDLAIFDSVANQLTIYAGSISGLVPAMSFSIGSGVGKKLQATGGDFDGDSLGDVAILQTLVSGSGGAASEGTTYFFSNLAGQLTTPTLSQATVRINSEAGAGIVDALSPTPFNDTNGDGLSDLITGARFADVSSGSGLSIDAGRSFTVTGSAQRGTLPSQYSILANSSVSGSGDFVVDRATGQPARFPEQLNPSAPDSRYVLTPSQSERSYRLSTLGDGLPGNSISVSSVDAQAYSQVPTTYAQSVQLLNNTITQKDQGPLLIGPVTPGIQRGYAEYDLSSLLPYRDNLAALQGATLDFSYSGKSTNLPTTPGGAIPQDLVSLGGRLFTVMGDYNAPSGQLPLQ